MPLSLSDLNLRCSSFQSGYYRYYPELKEYFRLLELSGCRTTEPLDITRWSYVNSSTLYLMPLKGNFQRIINIGSECQSFAEDVRLNRKPFRGRTLANVYSSFNDIRTFRNCKSQDKPVSVYIFRYRFVKSLFNSGLSLAQVANSMGYQSSETPQYYQQAQLVEDSFDLPPYSCVVGGQIWSTRNWDTSDQNSLISHYNLLPRNVAGAYVHQNYLPLLKSQLNGCRLPLREDVVQLNDYLLSINRKAYEMANPSTLRFMQFENHAKGLFNINLIGANDSGEVSSGRRPSFFRTWIDYRPTNFSYTARVNINSELASIISISSTVRCTVRLIYNQLIT